MTSVFIRADAAPIGISPLSHYDAFRLATCYRRASKRECCGIPQKYENVLCWVLWATRFKTLRLSSKVLKSWLIQLLVFHRDSAKKLKFQSGAAQREIYKSCE
ncbi:unnamed protein product [Brassica napus]|uniref:(rape) hypothetical protein n=1 Tax=Brassica napus TaxID=3708 RepID=A0A816SIA6_BRANA|nr:unnamed protein product [Brassica napus]